MERKLLCTLDVYKTLQLNTSWIWMVICVLCGCVAARAGSYDSGSQRMCQGKHCYRTGQLASQWQVVHAEQASVSYFNPDLHAIIESNASCRDDADTTPLEAVTTRLLNGYTDANYRKSEKVPRISREVLHSVIEAKLEGAPMMLDLYVIKRQGCIFDLSFAAPPAQFSAGSTAFAQFVQGFADDSRS